jgi:hypothetical protein
VGLISTAQTASLKRDTPELSAVNILVLNYRSDVANITPEGTSVSSGIFKVGAKILKYSFQFLHSSLMIVQHGVISAA